MRILVVSQYFWPENFRINDLVKELVHRGHKVTVLTGIPNYPQGKIYEAYDLRPNDFSHYEGAEVIRVPMLVRGASKLSLLLNYLSFLISGCLWGTWDLRGIVVDVIFVFEPSPVTVGIPAIWMGKIKRAPIVFWTLDLWPESLLAVGIRRSSMLYSCLELMVSFIYNRCSLVLGQSRGFLNSIANYCDDKSKVRYFPNWAEDLFMQVDVTPAPEVPKMENVFTVVCAGNIGEVQDMPSVLDAAEQLKDHPNIRWIFLGDGRKSEWFQREIIRRSLQKRIFPLGNFPLERMPSFYAHADALLVSLKRDPVYSLTIPGRLQTYLASGIPLLGMLDGEGAAVIRDAQAGLTCGAGDSAKLAQAIIALSVLPLEERRQLGVNGKNYANKEFARTRLMDHLEALLGEASENSKFSI